MRSVDFVHHQHHLLACSHQHHGNFPVSRSQALFSVSDEQYDIGHIHRYLSLLPHLRQYHILAGRLYSACIYQGEIGAVPFSFSIYSVSGHSRSVFHYRNASSDYFVEKGGFANIRPADDGHYRFTHRIFLL